MDNFKVIRVYDPAIDRDAMMADGDATENRWKLFSGCRDLDLISFVPGEKPTVFYCRPLSLQQQRQVRGLPEHDRYERAFAMSVVRVDDLTYPDGSRRTWVHRDSSKTLTDSELGLFAPVDVQEVGSVVEARSFLAHGAPLFVRVPDTSLGALTGQGIALRRHRAAQTKAQGADPSEGSKPLPEEREPMTP